MGSGPGHRGAIQYQYQYQYLETKYVAVQW